jgi:hypothetical protein
MLYGLAAIVGQGALMGHNQIVLSKSFAQGLPSGCLWVVA